MPLLFLELFEFDLQLILSERRLAVGSVALSGSKSLFQFQTLRDFCGSQKVQKFFRGFPRFQVCQLLSPAALASFSEQLTEQYFALHVQGIEFVSFFLHEFAKLLLI